MTTPFSNIGAKIINKNGCDTLECTMEPGASLITNQDSMCYMEGGIVTKVTSGSSGIGGMFRRAITDSSFFQNAVTNAASIKQKIVLSPLMQGSIVEIVIQPGETWRFANKTFLACSPNLQVSGNLNIFRNFRMSLINGNFTYVTITAPTEVGVAWVTGYGGITKHEIIVGINSIPLLINNGYFLGMLDKTNTIDYWKDYTTLTTPGSLFSSFMTDIGFVMKVGEKNSSKPLRDGKVVCTVYTQTLNPHAFEKYIEGIAKRESGGTSVKGEVAEGVATGIFSLFSGGRRRTRRINRRKR